MSVADILAQSDPTGSLSRFVLEVINGVIEGDACAARERVRAYRAHLETIAMGEDTDPAEAAEALKQAVEAGVLPPPLVNRGTVITGRFSAQTEWRTDAEGTLSIGVGAVAVGLGFSASYARQQAEASEFTITLEPTGETMLTALATMHQDANRQRALPEPGETPTQ